MLVANRRTFALSISTPVYPLSVSIERLVQVGEELLLLWAPSWVLRRECPSRHDRSRECPSGPVRTLSTKSISVRHSHLSKIRGEKETISKFRPWYLAIRR